MKKIYIASPYTKGRTSENVHESMKAFDLLMQAGFAPFSPLLSHFQDISFPGHSYDAWLNLDIEWLSVCDALVRLPGESPGADIEVAYAIRHNIPVFYGLDEIIDTNQ